MANVTTYYYSIDNTGAVRSNGITASLFGTSSRAITSSFATTSSYALNGGGSPTYTSSLWGTASWAQSASWAPSAGLVDGNTYSITSSWAVNVVNGGSVPSTYTTINSSSTNWITCSFSIAEQYFNLTNGFLYSFTQSNAPNVGYFKDIRLFVNNTSIATSSLSFPSTWKNLSGGWPTNITASKSFMIVLTAYDSASVVGSFIAEI